MSDSSFTVVPGFCFRSDYRKRGRKKEETKTGSVSFLSIFLFPDLFCPCKKLRRIRKPGGAPWSPSKVSLCSRPGWLQSGLWTIHLPLRPFLSKQRICWAFIWSSTVLACRSVMPKVAAIFGVVTVGSERNKFRTDVAFLSISSDFLPDFFRNVTLRFQKRQDQSRSVGQSRSKLFFNLWFLQSLIFPYIKDIRNTGTGMFTDTRDKSTLYYMFREIFISFLLFESMVAKR